jgi:hypothetical protein
MNNKKFTSIREIPKEAIEMIDEVQWYFRIPGTKNIIQEDERLASTDLLWICNSLNNEGISPNYYYIEPSELEDRTYGINLYKKIHGEK